MQNWPADSKKNIQRSVWTPVFNSSSFQLIQFSTHPVFKSSSFQLIQFSSHPVFNSSSFQLIQFSTHPVFILLSLAFNFRATFRSPYITWDYLKNLDWKRPKKPKTNQKKLDLDTTEFKFILKEIFSTSNFSISQFFNFSISKHCYIFDITFTSILFDIFNINKTLPC